MKLKPCPFCGSTAFIEETDPEFKDMFPYRIMCGNDVCPGSHVWFDTEKAAICTTAAQLIAPPEEG